MKTKYFLLIFSLISLLILSACKNPFRYTDAREIPVDGEERVKKNIEEGSCRNGGWLWTPALQAQYDKQLLNEALAKLWDES